MCPIRILTIGKTGKSEKDPVPNFVGAPGVDQRSLHPFTDSMAHCRFPHLLSAISVSMNGKDLLRPEKSLRLYLTAVPNQRLPGGQNCKICGREEILKIFVQTFFSFFSEESRFFLPFFLLTRNHSSMLSRMNSPRSSNSWAEFFQKSLKASALCPNA